MLSEFEQNLKCPTCELHMLEEPLLFEELSLESQWNLINEKATKYIALVCQSCGIDGIYIIETKKEA